MRKLVPLPALKGTVVARKVPKPIHMFFIDAGQVKMSNTSVTDEGLLPLDGWRCFKYANKEIALMKPTESQQVAQLTSDIATSADVNSKTTQQRSSIV